MTWSRAISAPIAVAADADLRVKIFTTEQADILRNRFDKVEALSGWAHDDVLRGDDRTAGEPQLVGGVGANEAIFFNDGLDQAGIDRIAGLSQIVQVGANGFFEAGNILLGGAGSDMLQGNAGDDILDGDRWLNVRIRLTAPNAENIPANEIASIDSLKHVFAATDAYGNSVPSAWVGKSLFELMIDRVITPTQLHIVREVVTADVSDGDIDVALFNDVFANYTIIQNGDGSVTDRHDTVSAVIDPQTGRQLLSDGTDTLRNIEIARFVDRDFSLVNAAPTGALMITGTENVLTANRSAVQDADGMPAANNAYSYQWQRSANGVDGWVNVGTGTTFNINNNQDFHRVIMTYTDLNGRVETVTSAITARVGTNGAETLNGSVGANLLNGRNGNDTINGLDGDDIINGGGGNDVLGGGIGNDTIFGGTGADTINGGDGDDVIVFDIDGNNGGNDVVSGGAGFDTLAIIDTGIGNETLNVVFNGARLTQVEGGGSIAADVESITADLAGGTGDALVYSATSAAVTVDLGAGTASGFTSIASIENVTGTNNADVLTGNAANNALTGGSGNDTLTGGAGNDNLNGGAGTDRAVFANAAAAHSFALNGTNLVVTGAEGTDTLISIEQLQFGATVYSAATNALVQGTNGNNNAVNGGANSELILGFNGNDVINGNGGNDIIFGGAGNDTINAGAGDDTIVWNVGDGRDIINGGADNDTVIINGNAANEVFRVYTRAAWGAVGGQQPCQPRRRHRNRDHPQRDQLQLGDHRTDGRRRDRHQHRRR
ncbi:MAG: calcium-binding protein [Rhodobacteraceae bacterium]|nr:calcium-binding protein [Paracoccaceae bacterium]